MSSPEDRLRAELARAARPASPDGVLDRVRARRGRVAIMHRVRVAALGVAVVAGTAGGTYGLARVFGSPGQRAADGIVTPSTGASGVVTFIDSPAPTGTWGTVVPTVSPPPSPEPSGDPGCDPSVVRGDFDGDGLLDTATVLRAACEGFLNPPPEWAVRLDWNGPTGTWPIHECVEWCQALAAPDLDGDGRDELLIQVNAFSIRQVVVYEALPREPGPVAVTVAPPGDPEGDLPPGDPASLWLGGDAWWTYNVRCEQADGGRQLIVTAAEVRPHDDPEGEWHVHETLLRLVGSPPVESPEPYEPPRFEVVSIRDYVVPTDSPQDDHLFFTGDRLCGAPLVEGGS